MLRGPAGGAEATESPTKFHFGSRIGPYGPPVLAVSPISWTRVDARFRPPSIEGLRPGCHGIGRRSSACLIPGPSAAPPPWRGCPIYSYNTASLGT